MERGKMSSTGRGGKSKAPQHPQDIFALGSKSTVVVSRDSEKRNIHKPSTSGSTERKREAPSYGSQPPGKRSRIGSPAESVTCTSLEVDPVDLVPHVLQALDTHNSDKLLGLLTGSIRLLKSQRSKPDPILCMSMLYLTKIRPNMFAHETVSQSLCSLLKREQGAGFKSKGNPLVFVLACNMLYAAHKDSRNWPDTLIKVYIEDALNERWWVDYGWCKCLVENIVTAFNTKQPPAHLLPAETLGTMSPSGAGAGSPSVGVDDDVDITDLEYAVFPRYSSSYEHVEGLVLEAIKEQIQRRAAPDAIGKGFLKLLAATCGFPEIRMISASRLEAWLHSGKLWRAAVELLAHVCCNCDARGATAARDHEALAQLARMRLKTKPLQQAYVNCLREMVSGSPALLRGVVTHTIYNELSTVRSPNNMAVLTALVLAQPQLVPQAMADTYMELLLRPEEYLRPLRALTREVAVRGRGDCALVPLARALAALAAPPPPPPPPLHEPHNEIRERAFNGIADLFCLCCLIIASHSKHVPDCRQQISAVQAAATGWLLETAAVYRPSRHDYWLALNKIMFVESAETYSKVDNWPPESERALLHRTCCEAPLPQHTLLRLIFIGLSKEIPISGAEILEMVETLVRRACALPPEEAPLQLDKLEVAEYIFQLCQFHPPDNITLPAGYTPPSLAVTAQYWRAWSVLLVLSAHNAHEWAARAAALYPTLRALIDLAITGKPSIEWSNNTQAEAEAERAAILQFESHLAAASNSKLPITEHNCRLPSQLTILEPSGPARRPPAAVLEALVSTCSTLRLGRLLCRQPALLLELVERHGTRQAMPWLLQLLQRDQLQLSVLPVQCLCEFVSRGGGAGSAERARHLARHLRRTAAECAAAARAVLLYYTGKLALPQAAVRAQAHRGLKLVLMQNPDDITETEFNAEVSPEEWIDKLWELPQWGAVSEAVVTSVLAACHVECAPSHLAAYLALLARHVLDTPAVHHHLLVRELSQVLMERTSVMAALLPSGDAVSPPDPDSALNPHRNLYNLTTIFYQHIQKIRVRADSAEAEAAAAAAAAAETETAEAAEGTCLRWARHVAHAPLLLAHAHLRLLCQGPSYYDTNQTMYNYLISIWTGPEAPVALDAAGAETPLLPDWLRLHLVRSARPPLLEAGLRGLPAHKLALFIQTFGMPVPAMSALLSALDACPMGAVARLGVERAYMSQLLRVQRARGAAGGAAFAAALQLHAPELPPEDTLFAPIARAREARGAWGGAAGRGLDAREVPSLLHAPHTDPAYTILYDKLMDEAALVSGDPSSATPYLCAVLMTSPLVPPPPPLLRALMPHARGPRAHEILQLSESLCACEGALGSTARALRAAAAAAAAAEPRPQLPPRATKQQLLLALESATPDSLESIGNRIIESQDTQLVIDVITTVLEKNQAGEYDVKIKTELDEEQTVHVFSGRGRGCGLLLDWLSDLQQETLGDQPERQMRVMFTAWGAAWRPLVVRQLAHRGSWRTLHACLAALLDPAHSAHSAHAWSPTMVLQFAETLVRSPRVWHGRHDASSKHHQPEDLLRLSHQQLCTLVSYIVREAATSSDPECIRQTIERRLPLLLQCCSPAALLCAVPASASALDPDSAATSADLDADNVALASEILLITLYMKVPKMEKLVSESWSRPRGPRRRRADGSAHAHVARDAHAATDVVSHAALGALAALAALPAAAPDGPAKIQRLEAGVRALWARSPGGAGAGARALPLVAALMRGSRPREPHLTHLLAALEMLSDEALFSDHNSKDLGDILECLMNSASEGGRGGGGGGGGGGGATAVSHRVAALWRRYMATKPHRAAAALHSYRAVVAGVPALSALAAAGGEAGPASAQPPPHALLALQRRRDPPEMMHWPLQEVEAWGVRRGGAWGGRAAAAVLQRAAAPLCASPRRHVRAAALSLLVKLLPACEDTTPALHVILECLESPQAELAHSVLERLSELLPGMMCHAHCILMKVFELGMKSRLPAEQALAKCVSTVNLLRGC